MEGQITGQPIQQHLHTATSAYLNQRRGTRSADTARKSSRRWRCAGREVSCAVGGGGGEYAIKEEQQAVAVCGEGGELRSGRGGGYAIKHQPK